MTGMLSQEEIDALLNGTASDSSEGEIVKMLSTQDEDILGEIGNISMGTAATTLFTLLGQKVTITTPRVFETNLAGLKEDFTSPSVLITIKYIDGIKGLNLLILHERDVKVITDLMMGGDGSNVSSELTDLHLSAISEAMNQMIGSSSTSLSEMLNKKIDISPPEAMYEQVKDMDTDQLQITEHEHLVKIAFRMTVGDLIDSEIMQVLPLDVARQLVDSLMNVSGPAPKETIDEGPPPVKEEPKVQPQEPQYQEPQYQQPPQQQPQQPQYQQSVPQQPQYQQPQYQQPQYQQLHQNPVNVQAFQLENFDEQGSMMGLGVDINLIKDVPLEITVELGRTSKQISDILDFGVGTVIELDRLVGEPLDILANGKKIARGEVVVVDENYGIRITDIIVSEKIVNNI
jgi:flagellar motor switch protein FliN/FliY